MFLSSQGSIAINTTEGSATVNPRGGESRHVHDFRERGNTSLQGCETGIQEPRVKLRSSEWEQAATRARQRDREKGKVMIGVPFHIELVYSATGTHTLDPWVRNRGRSERTLCGAGCGRRHRL